MERKLDWFFEPGVSTPYTGVNMPGSSQFRPRLKREKYNPENDPEFADEFKDYFSEPPPPAFKEPTPGKYYYILIK